MFYHQKIMLALLEEDNPERVYFHALPLLTSEGACVEDAVKEFPDNGFLRIVPDKNERFTFKERMSSLGKCCLIDLESFPPHANKIRANRNYSPESGETHQFIIYSDAIKALPAEFIFHVVTGKTGEPVENCFTPLCYFRDGGHIEGPYDPKTGAPYGPQSCLPPDSGRLFTVKLPTGEESLFFWASSQIETFAETVPTADKFIEATPETVNTVNGSAQNIIEEIAKSLPSLPNSLKTNERPVLLPMPEISDGGTNSKGTPLYSCGNKENSVYKSRSRLSGIVGRFSRDSRLEDLGANTSQKARRSTVNTPVDRYKQTIDQVWTVPETRDQAIKYLIQLPSAQSLISSAIAETGQSTPVTAFKQQLEDLEADRLSLMMQIERYRGEEKELELKVTKHLKEKAQKDVEQLSMQQAAFKEQCLQLQEQQTRLLEERNRLIRDLESIGGLPHLLSPDAAEEKELQEIFQDICTHLKAKGFVCSQNDAVHLMCLLAIFPTLQLCSDSLADSLLAARCLSSALGAAETGPLAKGETPTYLSGSNGMAFALVEEPSKHEVPYTCLVISKQYSPLGPIYEWAQWPLIRISIKAKHWNHLPDEIPVCLQSVYQALESQQLHTLPQSAEDLLEELYTFLSYEGRPVPLLLQQRLSTYLRFASPLLSGGIAAALDFAIVSILVPFAIFYQLPLQDALRNEEPSTLPLTFQWLNSSI